MVLISAKLLVYFCHFTVVLMTKPLPLYHSKWDVVMLLNLCVVFAPMLRILVLFE